MCLYSALRQALCDVSGNILATQVQEWTVGQGGSDKRDQGRRITFGRPDLKPRLPRGLGRALTDAKRQMGQGMTLGQPSGGLGPGFGGEDQRSEWQVGQGGVQVFGLHQGRDDDRQRADSREHLGGKALALWRGAGQKKGGGAGLSGHDQGVTCAEPPRQRKARSDRDDAGADLSWHRI